LSLADDAAEAAPAHAEAIRKAVALEARPAGQPLDVPAVLSTIRKAISALHEAVGQAINEILPRGNPARREVDAIFEQRRYAEALRRARSTTAPARPPAGAAILDFGSPDEDEEPASPLQEQRQPERGQPWRALMSPRAPEPSLRSAVSFFLLGAKTETETNTVVLERQRSGARTLRTIIVAALMSLLTWSFYSQDFFGNVAQLIQLFTLGFTTNFTADALFGALQAKKD
jgi:hypothetical protein